MLLKNHFEIITLVLEKGSEASILGSQVTCFFTSASRVGFLRGIAMTDEILGGRAGVQMSPL